MRPVQTGRHQHLHPKYWRVRHLPHINREKQIAFSQLLPRNVLHNEIFHW